MINKQTQIDKEKTPFLEDFGIWIWIKFFKRIYDKALCHQSFGLKLRINSMDI